MRHTKREEEGERERERQQIERAAHFVLSFAFRVSLVFEQSEVA